MIFVWLATWAPGLSREQLEGALERRATWNYPAGVHVLGEYWPANHSPASVIIFEADSYEPLLDMKLFWGDVFDITVSPACTPEQGLEWGSAIIQRRGS